MSISFLSLCLGCEEMTLEKNLEFLFFQLHLGGAHRERSWFCWDAADLLNSSQTDT